MFTSVTQKRLVSIAVALAACFVLLLAACTGQSQSSSSSAAASSTSSISASASGSSGTDESVDAPDPEPDDPESEDPEPDDPEPEDPEPNAPIVSPTATMTPQPKSTVGTLDYKKYPLIVKHDYKTPEGLTVAEDQQYTSMDEVALYLHTFGHLPSNYVLKKTAREAGWVASDGNLWDVLPGVSIGGSSWNPDEGQLPKIKGRAFYEADINYKGGYRNAERLIYTSDGLIFYTPDHYETYWHLY